MKITIYEASNRLGGWIDSEEVKVKGLTGEKGSVWFQRGARMVNPQHSKGPLYRYDDLAFYLLVRKNIFVWKLFEWGWDGKLMME